MKLSPALYFFFFEKLKTKLYQTDFKKSVDDGKSIQDIWKKKAENEKGKETGVPFITDKFGVKPLYFYEKCTAAKGTDDIPLRDWSFVKAVEYIENVPKELEYSGSDWHQEAERIKAELQKSYDAENRSAPEEQTEEEHREEEKGDRAYRSDLPALHICEDHLYGFFKLVLNKEYLDAWNLLDPDYQVRRFKKYDNFVVYFRTFETIFFTISFLEYKINWHNPKKFRTATIGVGGYVDLRLLDLHQILNPVGHTREEIIRQRTQPYSYIFNQGSKVYGDLENAKNVIQKWFPMHGEKKRFKNIYDIEKNILNNANFQQLLWPDCEALDYFLSPSYPNFRYREFITDKRVEFRYWPQYDKWLINGIDFFEIQTPDIEYFI